MPDQERLWPPGAVRPWHNGRRQRTDDVAWARSAENKENMRSAENNDMGRDSKNRSTPRPGRPAGVSVRIVALMERHGDE